MFDLQRFSRLAKAHWFENWKAYAWFLGIGMMLHFVVVLVQLVSEMGFTAFREDSQGLLYYSGLLLLSPIFAGRYFQKMSNRQSALLQLMRPATAFEKWLLALIFVVILFPLAYTLAFYVCDLPGLSLARGQAAAQAAAAAAREAAGASVGNDAEALGFGLNLAEYRLFFLKPSGATWIEMLPMLLFLLLLQGSAVFGSLYFQRAPFIKTLLAGFLFLLLAILLVNLAGSAPEQFLSFFLNDEPLPPLRRIAYATLWFGAPLALWLACYVALKEREIA